MFRRIRIAALLLILLFVSIGTFLDDHYGRQWNAPFVVALYPVSGDGSGATEQYLAKLTNEDFAPLEQFFRDEAHEYGVTLDRPIRLTLATPLRESPPKPPTLEPNVIEIMLWSLHLRWWAWRNAPNPSGPTPRIRIFALYYDPAKHAVLDHSTGLTKGRLGIANLFADKRMGGSNQAVIAHELLHTLGATDKYDPADNQPRFPDGYAEPDASPRYPQRFAELMAGRIPQSPTNAEIPESLAQVVIGSSTAAEIGWIEH